VGVTHFCGIGGAGVEKLSTCRQPCR
jgi:hypothetical protein